MLKITLKGGDIREVAEGTTVDALCRDISMGLYRNACAARIDGAVARACAGAKGKGSTGARPGP